MTVIPNPISTLDTSVLGRVRDRPSMARERAARRFRTGVAPAGGAPGSAVVPDGAVGAVVVVVVVMVVCTVVLLRSPWFRDRCPGRGGRRRTGRPLRVRPTARRADRPARRLQGRLGPQVGEADGCRGQQPCGQQPAGDPREERQGGRRPPPAGSWSRFRRRSRTSPYRRTRRTPGNPGRRTRRGHRTSRPTRQPVSPPPANDPAAPPPDDGTEVAPAPAPAT